MATDVRREILNLLEHRTHSKPHVVAPDIMKLEGHHPRAHIGMCFLGRKTGHQQSDQRMQYCERISKRSQCNSRHQEGAIRCCRRFVGLHSEPAARKLWWATGCLQLFSRNPRHPKCDKEGIPISFGHAALGNPSMSSDRLSVSTARGKSGLLSMGLFRLGPQCGKSRPLRVNCCCPGVFRGSSFPPASSTLALCGIRPRSSDYRRLRSCR